MARRLYDAYGKKLIASHRRKLIPRIFDVSFSDRVGGTAPTQIDGGYINESIYSVNGGAITGMRDVNDVGYAFNMTFTPLGNVYGTNDGTENDTEYFTEETKEHNIRFDGGILLKFTGPWFFILSDIKREDVIILQNTSNSVDDCSYYTKVEEEPIYYGDAYNNETEDKSEKITMHSTFEVDIQLFPDVGADWGYLSALRLIAYE
jgi:hypothetical protein